MGCVCTSELKSPHENIFDFSYITIRFSDDESSFETPDPICIYPAEINRLHTTEANYSEFIDSEFVIPTEAKSAYPTASESTHIKVANCKSSPISTVSESQSFDYSRRKPRNSIPAINSGDLMKYHPGLSSQFISRFCILTSTDFSYFKSLHAYALSDKPLLSLPISLIKSVSHASFHVPEKILKFNKSNNLYQFEIFLKHEDEMTAMSRSTDIVPINSTIAMKSSVIQMEDSVEDGRLMKRPIRPDSPTRTYNHVDRISWSFREIEWCTAERRLLFSAKNHEDACKWVNDIQKLIN